MGNFSVTDKCNCSYNSTYSGKLTHEVVEALDREVSAGVRNWQQCACACEFAGERKEVCQTPCFAGFVA